MPDKCTKCDEFIRDTTVTFEKKPYHPECFVCHQCRKKLSGKAIFQHEGNNYDEDCYSLFHAKKCAVCFKPLTETNVKFVVYDGKSFHKDCFVCSGCKKSLSGEKFYLQGDDRICEKCK